MDDLTSRGFDGSVTYTGAAARDLEYLCRCANQRRDNRYDRLLPAVQLAIFGFEAGYDVTEEQPPGDAQIALENDDTDVSLDSYEVVNLYAEYKPRRMENLNVRMDVQNLFDATYTSRSSDGLGLANVVPLTEPGRTVSLTASISF